jgi:glutamine amidotransferase
LTVVLDYGMGNLRSVQKAVEHLGSECRIQPNLDGATKLIIPGVGAFGVAMQRLRPLAAEIKGYIASGEPLLGVCLGQQVLFQRSEEHGKNEGLGVLNGTVRYLHRAPGNKVPNVGWCSVNARAGSKLFEGVQEGSQFYFVHSLYTDCEDQADVAAVAPHAVPFPAAIERGRLWATQFHPEKSGAAGLRVLENFLQC